MSVSEAFASLKSSPLGIAALLELRRVTMAARVFATVP